MGFFGVGLARHHLFRPSNIGVYLFREGLTERCVIGRFLGGPCFQLAAEMNHQARYQVHIKLGLPYSSGRGMVVQLGLMTY